MGEKTAYSQSVVSDRDTLTVIKHSDSPFIHLGMFSEGVRDEIVIRSPQQAGLLIAMLTQCLALKE